VDDSHLTVRRPKNMSLDISKAEKIFEKKLETIDESINKYKNLINSDYKNVINNSSSMYILGIHNCYDSGAAIFKDGKCLFAVNEERLTRIKMDDAFPEKSIKACLDYAGIKKEDLDVVSYGWHKGFDYGQHLVDYVKRAVEIAKDGENAEKIMLERIKVEVERSLPRKADFDQKMQEMGLADKVEYFDHHKSHCAAAFYTSPFDEALVFTLDAAGDFRSGVVAIGKGKEIKEVSSNYTWDSLGFLYGQITELLGFKPHRHEGKVTGLAAHGDPSKCIDIMRDMIEVRDGKIVAKVGKYYKPFFFQQTEELKEALKGHTREDIAAAVQRHTEDVVVKYIKYYVDKYNISKLALNGGLFANVRLNQKVREIEGVSDIYIFPHMGDGGLSYGSALLSANKRNLDCEKVKNVYLGMESFDEEVEEELSRRSDSLSYTKLSYEDAVSKVIEMLKEDTIIGLFQGRMEYGPRALGNRTVLYHAKDPKVNDWLNKRLRRTEFMPFAPVTTKDLAPKCFIGWEHHFITTNFMTECFDCTDEMKEKEPAVVHVDGTARPQIVEREDNKFYYDIIMAWNKENESLCVINTSFNEHEQPIVGKIADALDSLINDNVDCVVANEKYIIRKK
jgi:carbamoyltransferase